MKPLLLRIWRDVPFPAWLRHVFLRVLNPAWMIGAMAVIVDDQGRTLVLRHTYRRERPWGLPGGWLKRAESPEAGLRREVFEETGLRVRVEGLLAADFWGNGQFDLLYRCAVEGGTYHATDETSGAHWATPAELPGLLLPNQRRLLARAGLMPAGDGPPGGR